MLWLHLAGLGVMAASGVLLVLSASPLPRYTDTNLPASLPSLSQPFAIGVDCPQHLRLGDSGVLSLSLAKESIGGPADDGALAVAHVDAAGLRLDPPGDVAQPFTPAVQNVAWRWNILAEGAPGRYKVNVIIRLRPAAGVTAPEAALWARTFEVEVTPVLGMPAPWMRAAGFTGSLVGFILLAVAVGFQIRQFRLSGRGWPPPKTGRPQGSPQH